MNIKINLITAFALLAALAGSGTASAACNADPIVRQVAPYISLAIAA